MLYSITRAAEVIDEYIPKMGRYSGEDYSGDPEEIARHIRTIAMSAEDDDIRNELERLAKKIPKM